LGDRFCVSSCKFYSLNDLKRFYMRNRIRRNCNLKALLDIIVHLEYLSKFVYKELIFVK